MLDSTIARTGRSLEGGLRGGMMLGQSINQGMSKNALQQAQARINAGEDANQVIQQLMAQDPAAAQQLMNLKQGNMTLQQQQQEMDMLKQKYGMESLRQAAMPLLGSIMQDDPKIQDKLIDEASGIFKGQSDGIFESLQGIKGLQGSQRVDALAGLVKTLRSAGVFPDDPSQMMGGGTALGQNLALYDQALASGDTQRAELIKRNLDPYSRSFAGGMGAGEARLATEQGLNPVLAQREAGKIQATEQTETGQAKLTQEQQAVQKGEREFNDAARAKENSVAAINQQLQQLDRLEKHPGFGNAVGLNSVLPSVPGSKAYGFEKQLEKLDAQSFMAMIPNLAGMGALSNAEGAKVSAALSALSAGLSEEEFKSEMQVIKETLMQARDRIRTGNLVKPEQQSQPASNVGRFKIEVE